MANVMSDPAFRIYALCCAILAINLIFLSAYTAVQRVRNQSLSNPEDPGFDPGKGGEHAAVTRALRAHRNALENIVPFYAVALIYVLSGASLTGARILLGGFTAARVLHTGAHLSGLQPWRTIFFAVGAVCLGVLVVEVLISALR